MPHLPQYLRMTKNILAQLYQIKNGSAHPSDWIMPQKQLQPLVAAELKKNYWNRVDRGVVKEVALGFCILDPEPDYPDGLYEERGEIEQIRIALHMQKVIEARFPVEILQDEKNLAP